MRIDGDETIKDSIDLPSLQMISDHSRIQRCAFGKLTVLNHALCINISHDRFTLEKYYDGK